VAEYRQLSSCGTLHQLQQRRVMVKDDNYITHTYAVLDAGKQTASKGTVCVCYKTIIHKQIIICSSIYRDKCFALPNCFVLVG